MLTVSGGAVTSLKNGASVVNPSNYTVVGDELTIGKDYLKTLSEGEKTFTIISKTDVTTVVITIQTTA